MGDPKTGRCIGGDDAVEEGGEKKRMYGIGEPQARGRGPVATLCTQGQRSVEAAGKQSCTTLPTYLP